MRHVLCTSGLELATISIHALTRSATWPWNPLEKVTIISIHALTRSATSSNRICLNCNRFQSTHSRGVRQLKGLGLRIQGAFQSTHSRGVRLRNQDGVLWVFSISIHALTRSATHKSSCSPNQRIFQSTHSRGVRPSSSSLISSDAHFNPRTHEECDALPHELIHPTCYFNPRTHEECD